MSNNVVSQQMPIQSVQMGQLEPISNKLDSSIQMGIIGPGINSPTLQQMSMPNMQMGMMGPGSTDALSRQISVPNNQAQPLETMPNNHVLQKLSVSNMQMGQMDPQTYNLVPQQFSLPSKQLGEMEAMLNNVGSQQSSMLNKRKAPIESTSINYGLPKLSMPNKRVGKMEHRPWLQQMSTPNKLSMQMQLQSISNTSSLQRSQAPSKKVASSKAGLQQSSVQKNQSGQPSPKVQNESSESVRSKLRESLAAALALVSRQQERPSSKGKSSENEAASTAGSVQENSQPSGHASGTVNAVSQASEEPKDPLAQQCNDGQSTSQGISSNNTGDSTQTSKNDGQDCLPTISMLDEDASFSDSFLVKDELLQGNGLSWLLEADMKVAEKKDIETAQKQPELEDICRDSGGQVVLSPQILASQIEAELYKLFGGVNKKYKEKGRSLLFNLKDHNNPELREKVLSGEIPPERLCSMTAEELASKELSEWRIAKAEELAQMVVLPDSDVDMRRLVKKTHKGEFQVEVEPQDSVSAEVSIGASSLTRIRRRPKEKEASSPSKPDQMQDKGKNAASEKSSTEDQDVIMIPSTEGTDFMQGLMVDDELKDAEFLPPIVSLDEFMESLNSEPPFENLPVDAEKMPASDKDDSQASSESKSPDATLRDSDDSTSGKPDVVDVANTKSDADRKSIGNNVKSEAAPLVSIPKGEHVWEGLLQLNISVTASVVGIFKSGEKTSAKDWPGFIEVKGRVRMDAFEKFLQELPMSRSRAVMAVHFVCKEGSAESENAGVSEVAESYLVDGRVGVAEPASGVELYICPPHSKTNEMLGKVLPKDQIDALNAIDNGLIGVIVWRKPQIISPNSKSLHKHNSKKHHFSSRRHQEKDANVNVNVTPKPRAGLPLYTKPQSDNDNDDDDDDVPPGFGPSSTRDEDDLPEFNFSSGSVTPRRPFSTQSVRSQGMASFHQHSQTPSRPVDQMRQLVQRYGQPVTSASSGNCQDNNRGMVAVQPWNDDDDDMPEWNPEDSKQKLTHPPQPLHMHNIHQPILRAHMVQQTPHQQIAPPPDMPLQIRMNVVRGPPNGAAPSWQQSPWMAPTIVTHGLPPPAYQHNYGATGVEPWRRDTPKSRGF